MLSGKWLMVSGKWLIVNVITLTLLKLTATVFSIIPKDQHFLHTRSGCPLFYPYDIILITYPYHSVGASVQTCENGSHSREITQSGDIVAQ